MADFELGDDTEISKLSSLTIEDPEEFEHWEKLVRAVEAQEGGINRNSSPGAITLTRDVYDRFLARFPLFFGYWKKYADLEFTIGGTEAAEMVYERGVASIGISVDLWANYCGFKLETSHDPDVIRELFERGAESVGLDYLSHPFWDKYIEFEERLEQTSRVFAILARLIRVPMHQYARYYERFRSMAPSRPIEELATPEIVTRVSGEVERDLAHNVNPIGDQEAGVRVKLEALHLEIFNQTHTETTKRWTYEQEIKRPYFHVTELDDQQLANWRKYLDFEEAEGEYNRIKFLYERCLVTTANYDELWMRYVRWLMAQPGKTQEVRHAYQRAACIYIPVIRPTIRIWYANFEESIGCPEFAIDILDAILERLPNHVETIVALANTHRRQYGVSAAVDVIKRFIDIPLLALSTKGDLVSEWARMIWKANGNAEEARAIYRRNHYAYGSSFGYWANYFEFELQQPTSLADETATHKRIKDVYELIQHNSGLSPELIRQLSSKYFLYLMERGGKDAMDEFMLLDGAVYGPKNIAVGGTFSANIEKIENGQPYQMN